LRATIVQTCIGGQTTRRYGAGLTMLTACTTAVAGRLEQVRGLAASLAEHEPEATLSVLVLARDEAADPRREDFLVVTPTDLDVAQLDVLGATHAARELAQALLPAMLRALLAQSDHVLVLDHATHVTGPLSEIADAARAAGVLVDADGRLLGLGRSPQATAFLDAWDAHAAAPATPDATTYPAPPPWDRAPDPEEPEPATGWDRTWNGFPMTPLLRDVFAAGRRDGRIDRAPYEPAGEEQLLDVLRAPGAPPLDELPEDLAAVLAAERAHTPEAPALPRPPFGVNLVGYLQAELGVAEVARQVVGALDAQDVPVLPIGIVAPNSRQGHEYPHIDQFANPFAVNLLCVNADQTPHVARQAGDAFLAGRHTIGLWWWEVSAFPDYFRAAFDVVDEVWAGTTFVADTLRAVSPKPVVRVPMPVTLPPGIHADRARFGFEAEDVVYLYIYDYNSIFERKNPLGLVEAFRRAFPDDGALGARLVLKCINHEQHADQHARVVAATAGREDITILDRYLSAADKDALLASCDAYVSLHRSEGFGLTCAEAMLLGKPVVATAYSGAADYMLPGHSLPVRYDLVGVGPGNEPYPADGVWAAPDLDEAAAHLRVLAQDADLRRRVGDRARAFIEREFSPAAAGAAMRARLQTVAARVPAPAPLPVDGPWSAALEAARAAVDTGPAPATGPRWHPRRVARALALRATAPRARHQHAIDRRLIDATEWSIGQAARAAEAAARRSELAAWRTTAAGLREQRRLAARVRAVEEARPAPDADVSRVV
jgi:glycosyltransferase involved in cell wall biosynthesis